MTMIETRQVQVLAWVAAAGMATTWGVEAAARGDARRAALAQNRDTYSYYVGDKMWTAEKVVFGAGAGIAVLGAVMGGAPSRGWASAGAYLASTGVGLLLGGGLGMWLAAGSLGEVHHEP